MAVLVNSSMFDRCCSKSVLPWTIFDLRDSTVSLGDFYLCIIQERDCQIKEHELEEARVGWSKEQLDPVTLVSTLYLRCVYGMVCVCMHGLHMSHCLHVWHCVCVGGLVVWLVLYLVFLICSCRYAGCCCDISIWKLHALLCAV